MKGYTVLIKRINIIKNIQTIQNDLEIQCNLYPNAKGIFHRTRTNNPKIYMEPQRTLTSQSNLMKQDQSWRYHATWYQTIL